MRPVSLHLEPNVNAATCAQALMEVVHQEVRNPLGRWYRVEMIS